MQKLWKLTVILWAGFLIIITGCKKNVEDDLIELISINVTAPIKTEYFIGEELITEGLLVEAIYSWRRRY